MVHRTDLDIQLMVLDVEVHDTYSQPTLGMVYSFAPVLR
jgi:hypothetical protein